MISAKVESVLGLQEMYENVVEARERHLDYPGLIRPTTIIEDAMLSSLTSTQAVVVSETRQNTGAYKIRGALNAIDLLSEFEKAQGLVTASAGNYAAGTALVARALDVDLVVFAPKGTPETKIKNIRALGGSCVDIVLKGDTFNDSSAAAQDFQLETGRTFLHPYDDNNVIAGQGTLGLETASYLERKNLGVDTVLFPVGGGGLASGLATVFRSRFPRARLIGVEPEGAASMQLALKNGGPVPILGAIDKTVDGAATQVSGRLTTEYARRLGVEIATVSNDEVYDTTKMLWDRKNPHLKSELAGALAISALLKMKDEFRGQRVVTYVTGGNLGEDRFRDEVCAS